VEAQQRLMHRNDPTDPLAARIVRLDIGTCYNTIITVTLCRYIAAVLVVVSRGAGHACGRCILR
jgi:hypothetical protein